MIKVFFEHHSYHGAIKGVEAERTLKEQGGNCYLTRYSEARSVYVLSVFRGGDKRQQFAHFDILLHFNDEHHHSEKMYEIVGTEKRFGSVSDMLNFYGDTPINHQIRGIGVCVLSRPLSLDDDFMIEKMVTVLVNP